MPATPEQQSRQKIDAQLIAAGWMLQDCKQLNLDTARGIVLREVPLKSGPCDFSTT
jgi:type I restriction enzyme R subunit